MRKVYVILMAALLMAGLTAVVTAAGQTTPKSEPNQQTTMRCMGDVTAVDAAAKTFTVKDGEKTMNFMWNQDTKLTEARHPVTESSLTVGSKVSVHYSQMNGHNMAQQIAIHPATTTTAAPPPATHSTTKTTK
jgi:Cu/Ag efflux protein CusF